MVRNSHDLYSYRTASFMRRTTVTNRARSYPIDVAAIDIGSNAIRYVSASFVTPTVYTVIEQERLPVRLGHNVFLNGRLDDEAMDKAIAGLEVFRRRIKRLGIEHLRVIATSAVRESQNCKVFVDRARKEAGVEIDVITGAEEARLVYEAVKRTVKLAQKAAFLINVGGGSTELSLINDKEMLWNETRSVGAVRLYEEMCEDHKEPVRYEKLLEEYVDALKLTSDPELKHVDQFIATGGNIEELARIANHTEDRDVIVLTTQKLARTIKMLSRMSRQERIKRFNLKEDRADVILPAGMVYLRFAHLLKKDSLIVPSIGTKEGILFDLVNSVTEHSAHLVSQEKQLLSFASKIGRHYMFEKSHALHVQRLALSLFDQLAAMHGLSQRERNILIVASLLHDIGSFVSFKGHHKHSFYLITQTEIPGMSDRDTLIVANTARYHRKAEPSENHHGFSSLNKDEKIVVEKLASLLRVADALDRDHRQSVKSIITEVSGTTINLKVEGRGGLRLDRWAMMRKGELFTRVFGRKIKVLTKDNGDDICQ